MLYFGKTPREIEFRRKLFLFCFLAYVGNAFLVPLGLIAALDGNYRLALLILAAAVFITVNYVFARRYQVVRLPSALLSATLISLSFYITLTGGNQGTGILYTYGLVAMVIMILGPYVGTAVGLAYALTVYLVLKTDGLPGYGYDPLFEHRILLSTLSTISLISATEWVRVRSYDAISSTAESHHQEAMKDPLTGLLNRTGLEDQLENRSDDITPAIVAMIDIDHFKAVNDRLGHDIGDKALIAFARVLRNSIKEGDILCRWGGEEFVLVLHAIDMATAHRALDELRQLISHRIFVFDSHELTLQFSAGLATLSSKEHFRQALHQADAHLYQAKNRGRNRIISKISASPAHIQ